MQTRNSLKAKYEADLAELEQREAVLAILPAIDGIPVNHIHFAAKAEPWITHECAELSDALRVVGAFTLIPFDDVRGASRYVGPDAKARAEKDREKTIMHEGVTAPYLRLSCNVGEHSYRSRELTFWAKVGDRTARITVQEGVRGAWPYQWSIRATTREIAGHVTSAEFFPPDQKALGYDWSIKWGTGSKFSAEYTIGWQTLESFLTIAQAAAAEIMRQRAESRERAKADYLARRKPAEIEGRCRLVLDTLRRPDISTALNCTAWDLEAVRRVGYAEIQKAAGAHAPEVLKTGLHDFLNGVYYLSKDTDDYDSRVDYRDDLRETFDRMAKG